MHCALRPDLRVLSGGVGMLEPLQPGVELAEGDAAEILPGLPAADLILTSPPYDGLREYGGYGAAFDFGAIAAACAANLKPGGVLVWVVGDQVVDGGVTGTSFRQALAFMELGLTLHQPLIYARWNIAGVRRSAYFQSHEYMFVFAKGKPKSANPLHDKANAVAGRKYHFWGGGGTRGDNRFPRRESTRGYTAPETSRRGSIWEYAVSSSQPEENGDLPRAELDAHPARFPLALARDHILSWSVPGDLVIDPMAGSGTTLRAAADLGRRAIGAEVNPDYCRLIRRRLSQAPLAWRGSNFGNFPI